MFNASFLTCDFNSVRSCTLTLNCLPSSVGQRNENKSSVTSNSAPMHSGWGILLNIYKNNLYAATQDKVKWLIVHITLISSSQTVQDEFFAVPYSITENAVNIQACIDLEFFLLYLQYWIKAWIKNTSFENQLKSFLFSLQRLLTVSSFFPFWKSEQVHYVRDELLIWIP